MAKREIKVLVYFQEITREDGALLDLAGTLDRIAALPLEQRNVMIGTDAIRLERVLAGSGCRVYDLVKLRIGDYTETGGLSTPSTELQLDDDKGIAEHTVLAIPKDTNVIAVCRTIYGLKAEGVARYVSHFLADHTPLIASVIQTGDPMLRAQSIKAARRLRLRVSKAALEASNARGIAAVREKLAGWLPFGESTIMVDLGAGRGKGKTLALPEVMAVTQALYKSDAVELLELEGTRTDGERDKIDFLANRLTETVLVQTEHRGLTAHDRARAVEEAIVKNRDHLQAYKNDRHVITI